MTTSVDLSVPVVSQQCAALALAAPPLFVGEDAAAYEDLHARVAGAMKPGDILEDIWVRDVVELVWDVVRLRRLKAALLAEAAPESLALVLRGLGESQPDALSRRWAAREPTAVGDVNERLAAAGLGMDAVVARCARARGRHAGAPDRRRGRERNAPRRRGAHRRGAGRSPARAPRAAGDNGRCAGGRGGDDAAFAHRPLRAAGMVATEVRDPAV
jgi:hypothetical protein